MELLCSTLKVTLDGVVLIDYTDLMETEPSLDASPLAQVIRPIRATHGKTLDRGVITHTLTFSRVAQHADFVEAQRSLLVFAASLQELEGTCTIQMKADAYEHTLANATLRPWRARVQHAYTFHNLQVTGGAFATVS